MKPAPTDASSTSWPFLQLSRGQRVVERERNRRCRGVAEPLDVDDHLAGIDAELLAGRLDDPPVRLVRHEQSPFIDLTPRGPEGLFDETTVDQLISVLDEIRRTAVAA